jgi:hypothetical protein
MRCALYVTLMLHEHFDRALLALAKGGYKIDSPYLIKGDATSPSSIMHLNIEQVNLSDSSDNMQKIVADIDKVLIAAGVKYYSLVSTNMLYSACSMSNIKLEKHIKPKKQIPSYLKVVEPPENPNDPKHPTN